MNPFDSYTTAARDKLAAARTDKQRRIARAELISWLTHAVVWRDGHACRYCRIETRTAPNGSPFQRTVDHIIPVSQGGEDTLDNLVLTCRSCNSRRGPRPLRAFARAGGEGA